MTQPAGEQPFKWIGEHHALDFTNTVDWVDGRATEGERLTTFERLVAWCEEAGVLDRAAARDLRQGGRRHPKIAAAALHRAHELRHLLHDIFFPIATGVRPAPARLRALNAALAEAPAVLGPEDGEVPLTWQWPPERSLTHILRPVVWSAATLLTSPALAQLGTCANDRCGWLFLDTSRRHNRKWCEMGVCGNRAKARRFQARRRRTPKT